MNTSPRIHRGPAGGGMSMAMKPDRQMDFPIWDSCRAQEVTDWAVDRKWQTEQWTGSDRLSSGQSLEGSCSSCSARALRAWQSNVSGLPSSRSPLQSGWTSSLPGWRKPQAGLGSSYSQSNTRRKIKHIRLTQTQTSLNWTISGDLPVLRNVGKIPTSPLNSWD